MTWNCATDTEISNRDVDCFETWDGGNAGAPTAPGVLHTRSLEGEVVWDVTDDVLAGTNAWLIKKQNEGQGGGVRYYSKEGAAEAGNLGLAPTLILTPAETPE